LAALECPIDERLTLDGCLRQIDFLDGDGYGSIGDIRRFSSRPS
jgi:hypothetical protein